jgi:hypothetical protein
MLCWGTDLRVRPNPSMQLAGISTLGSGIAGTENWLTGSRLRRSGPPRAAAERQRDVAAGRLRAPRLRELSSLYLYIEIERGDKCAKGTGAPTSPQGGPDSRRPCANLGLAGHRCLGPGGRTQQARPVLPPQEYPRWPGRGERLGDLVGDPHRAIRRKHPRPT